MEQDWTRFDICKLLPYLFDIPVNFPFTLSIHNNNNLFNDPSLTFPTLAPTWNLPVNLV